MTAEERGEAVLAVLRRAGAFGDDARVTGMSQLEGGWSRHSYVVTVADERAEHQLIVRARPPATPLDTDVEQEYRVYELLAESPVPIPRAYGIELGDTPFGGPFFVMDRLPGEAPNIWRRGDRAAIEQDWDEGRRQIAEDFVRNLVAIHSVDPEVAAAAVAPVSFEDMVARWRGVQEEMQLVRDPVADATYDWVASRRPDPVPPHLVHGDYRIGNCLIHEGRISGVLDWELAHVGDPRFDLAYTALGWYSGAFVLPASHLLGGVAESDWFHARYTELTGLESDPEVERTYAVLGGLMLYGMLVTGVRLYAEGQTSDIRMAWSRFVLPRLRQDFVRLMDW